MSPPAAPGATSRTRQPETRPAQLTAAALTLFLERGFAATRMEDIAQLAGVSKGTLYVYFDTKEELFRAVVREGIVPLIERAEAAVADFEGSARALLSTLLHGLLLEFWGSPSSGIPKMLIADANQFPGLAADYFRDISLRTRQLMEEILQRGIDTGEFRPLDVAYAARIILAALDHQAVLQHSMAVHDPEPLEPERFVDTVLDVLIEGMLAPGQRG